MDLKPSHRRPAGQHVSGPSQMSRALGSQLREIYSDVLNEPVPPRFHKLLDSMKESERSDS